MKSITGFDVGFAGITLVFVAFFGIPVPNPLIFQVTAALTGAIMALSGAKLLAAE